MIHKFTIFLTEEKQTDNMTVTKKRYLTFLFQVKWDFRSRQWRKLFLMQPSLEKKQHTNSWVLSYLRRNSTIKAHKEALLKIFYEKNAFNENAKHSITIMRNNTSSAERPWPIFSGAKNFFSKYNPGIYVLHKRVNTTVWL